MCIRGNFVSRLICTLKSKKNLKTFFLKTYQSINQYSNFPALTDRIMDRIKATGNSRLGIPGNLASKEFPGEFPGITEFSAGIAGNFKDFKI